MNLMYQFSYSERERERSAKRLRRFLMLAVIFTLALVLTRLCCGCAPAEPMYDFEKSGVPDTLDVPVRPAPMIPDTTDTAFWMLIVSGS